MMTALVATIPVALIADSATTNGAFSTAIHVVEIVRSRWYSVAFLTQFSSTNIILGKTFLCSCCGALPGPDIRYDASTNDE